MKARRVAATRSCFRPSPAFVAAALSACLMGCGSAPPAPDATATARADRIGRVETGLSTRILIEGEPRETFTIQERLRHHHVPGVSVAVIEDGRIAWSKGYGEADAVTGAPVTPRTLFQAASISKPVAAVGLLRLAERGRVALHGDVNRQLERWRLPAEGPMDAVVTPATLLRHTAGTTVSGFPGYAHDADIPTTLQVLEGAGPTNTDAIVVGWAPGTRWEYSGGGYTVLQLLMEDVADAAFPRLMDSLVLHPLGMDRSAYAQLLPPRLHDEAATAHDDSGKPIPGRWHSYPELAAAGLWTTATDIARFVIGVQRALAGEPGAILSRETAREMLEPGMNGWGLGFSMWGDDHARRFSHSGGNRGFRCLFYGFFQDGKGAVVMTNSDAGGDLIAEIMNAIGVEYDWPGMRRRIDRDRSLVELAGTYSLFGQEIVLEGRGDHLSAELPWGGTLSFYADADNGFFLADSGRPATFVRDGSGAVISLEVPGFGEVPRVR